MRCFLAVAAVFAAVLPTTAGAQEFAGLDVPGPALSVSDAQLAAVLTCSPGLDRASVTPVLLVQGTGATAHDNWSWTYEPALTKLGVPWCQVDLPDQATSDVQRAGEFVVASIRAMYSRAGRRVSIIGHSQGGMVPRWALRWWPDTRAMVDDLIGFAPSNHGTTSASQSCGDGSCSAANWQQWNISSFMKALNSRTETFAGLSYTNVVTRTDEIVAPFDSGFLTVGPGRIANVVTQDICPNALFEHLLVGTIDPVAYALAIDALTHDGPADSSRIALTTCAQPFHPGIDPVTGPGDGLAAAASFAAYEAAEVPAEPPLACYTTASCPVSAASTPGSVGVAIVPARLARESRPTCVKRSRFTVRVAGLRAARATFGHKRVALRRAGRGRLSVRIDLSRAAGRPVTLRVRGRDKRGRTVNLVRVYRRCG